MLSKNEIKHIKSLSIKKFRDEFSQATVEGDKIVEDLLTFMPEIIENIYCTEEWEAKHSQSGNISTKIISNEELNKISSLVTPHHVLAVIKTAYPLFNSSVLTNELILALDQIQDPGNLGTIIRTANWFGIKHIVCTNDTADIYNPKVIQASMGSVFRTQIYYTHLLEVIEKYSSQKIPIYGAFLEGENIFEQKLSPHGIIVLGNESKGISKQISKFISHPITIPPFDPQQHVESLNVAIAGAIVLARFRNA